MELIDKNKLIEYLGDKILYMQKNCIPTPEMKGWIESIKKTVNLIESGRFDVDKQKSLPREDAEL